MTTTVDSPFHFDSTLEALVELSDLAAEATSFAEEALYEKELTSLVKKALKKGDESDIQAALSLLQNEVGKGYDVLLAIAEEAAENIEEKNNAAALFLLPLFAWSRYSIASGKIKEDILKDVASLFLKTFAQKNTTASVCNLLLRSDDLPGTVGRVRSLLTRLAKEGSEKVTLVDAFDLLKPEATNDFADVRYLLLCVKGKDSVSLLKAFPSYQARARATMDYCIKAHALLEDALRGAVFEVQGPASFFLALEQSDIAMRSFALKSLVELTKTMGFYANELVGTVAIFHRPTESATQNNAELRVSISTMKDSSRVIAGVVLPCSKEDAESNQDTVVEVLQSAGLETLYPLSQIFTMEWCEDCGAPLYANPAGFVVHIEEAEEAEDFAPVLN